MGSIFLQTSHGVQRTSVAIPHPQILTGAHQKFCPTKHTCVPPPTDLIIYSKLKIANGLSCRAQNQLKKKKKMYSYNPKLFHFK